MILISISQPHTHTCQNKNMVVEQTTATLFLFIFLVALQSSPCITTTIAQKTSTSPLEQVLCNASNPSSPSPLFAQFLGFAINELKTAARANDNFKYYSAVSDYTPIVHASYLCQADATSKSCFDCVTRAAKTARSSCSKWSTEAVLYEENCTFRYSGKSFYGRFDNSSSYVDPLYEPLDSNTINVEKFGKALTQAIDVIVTDLRSKSNYGPKFGTDVAKVDGKTKIYAMGECTWDLYQEDCRLCVHECASLLPARKVGGRVMLPSCNFRYETNQFYDEASVVPSPSQPSPSHPGGHTRSPPPPLRPPKRKKKSHTKAIAAGTGGGALGLLAIAGGAVWAYQKKKTMQASQDPPEDTEAGPDSPKGSPENSSLPVGEETLADLAAETKEGRSGSSQVNDEELESKKRRPAPAKASRGARKNTEKRPPKP